MKAFMIQNAAVWSLMTICVMIANAQSGATNSGAAYLDGTQDRIRVLDTTPVNSNARPSAYQITGSSLTVEA